MLKKSRRDFLKATGIAALSAGFFSSSKINVFPQAFRQKSNRPNIVFLFSDDHTRDHMGCYGDKGIKTPNLDNMANEGIKFNRAYVASPQCSPSRASVLTGRFPHTVGASRLHSNALPEFTDIVRIFKSNGYYTGAYRKVHQDIIQKNFDFYGDDDEPLRTFFTERPKSKPFFLWFGSRDPHRPYGQGAFSPAHRPEDVTVPQFLPDTPKVRQDLAYYYDEIARFDKDCGIILELLDEYNLAQNTMVVMSGDNGMPFPRAKGTLYEPGVNVPLIIKWPGVIKGGSISNELISLIDLPATWLDIAGINIPQEFEGISLKPYLSNEIQYIPRGYTFFERNWHDNWVPQRGCVTDKYKMIINYRPEAAYLPSLDLYESDSFAEIMRLGDAGTLQGNLRWYMNTSTPIYELYDLERDHGEWQNLADNPNYKNIQDELLEAISTWMFETTDFLPPMKGSFPADYPQYANINPLNAGITWPNK